MENKADSSATAEKEVMLLPDDPMAAMQKMIAEMGHDLGAVIARCEVAAQKAESLIAQLEKETVSKSDGVQQPETSAQSLYREHQEKIDADAIAAMNANTAPKNAIDDATGAPSSVVEVAGTHSRTNVDGSRSAVTG